MADWYLRGNGLNAYNASSYTFVGSTPPACPGNGNICAVLAEDNGTGKPSLTLDLLTQIHTAESTGQDQSNVLLRNQV